MSIRRHIAPIRFGHGLRLGEPPPADPAAWLARQLSAPAADPTGVDAAGALAIRLEQHRLQQDRARQGIQPLRVARDPEPAHIWREMVAWTDHRLRSGQPFRDRLVDFWMNHFTISRRVGFAALLPGPFEREAIRPHVTGRFADMLVAAIRHPGMLLYLDNHLSVGPGSEAGRRVRRGLNENLAREVLELHTLSPAGGYTQGDIQALALILSGWSVSLDREPLGFVWRPEAHEPGQKRLLGRAFPEGPDSQEAALRFLASRPATYRHLAVKLARHFVADDPPPPAVRRLEATLRETDGDLRAVAQELIALPEAWDPPLTKFRTPIEHVLAAARAGGVGNGAPLVLPLRGLAQDLWNARQPDGWPDRAAAWATPEALLRRADWVHSFAGRIERADLAAVTEAALGPLARAETVRAMRGAGSVRDALTLLLASPEFMHR